MLYTYCADGHVFCPLQDPARFELGLTVVLAVDAFVEADERTGPILVLQSQRSSHPQRCNDYHNVLECHQVDKLANFSMLRRLKVSVPITNAPVAREESSIPKLWWLQALQHHQHTRLKHRQASSSLECLGKAVMESICSSHSTDTLLARLPLRGVRRRPCQAWPAGGLP